MERSKRREEDKKSKEAGEELERQPVVVGKCDFVTSLFIKVG